LVIKAGISRCFLLFQLVSDFVLFGIEGGSPIRIERPKGETKRRKLVDLAKRIRADPWRPELY
jgi:hypothetical protein